MSEVAIGHGNHRSRYRGHLEVIAGSMFSGKSEELIRRVRRAEIAKQKVQMFKPSIDNRYSSGTVNSHDKNSHPAIEIDEALQILDLLQEGTLVVAIDEAQFLDEAILDVADILTEEKNIRLIAAGLDMDFRGEPFGSMPALIAKAELIDKLHAICVICGEEASRNQRLVSGKPANFTDPVIMIGAQESYEARCRHCHIVPGRPRGYVYRADGDYSKE